MRGQQHPDTVTSSTRTAITAMTTAQYNAGQYRSSANRHLGKAPPIVDGPRRRAAGA